MLYGNNDSVNVFQQVQPVNNENRVLSFTLNSHACLS